MSQTVGKTRLAYARAWHHVDLAADARPLGRLASRIALTLMGKHKPIYSPATDCGDYVVATGCHDLHVTGRKRQQKLYYTHTTRPGSLKSMTLEQLQAKWGGAEVLRRAVRGMLPKNKLRDARMARLKAFEGPAHPYEANLLRSAGEGSGIREIPAVKSRLAEARNAAAQETAQAQAATTTTTPAS